MKFNIVNNDWMIDRAQQYYAVTGRSILDNLKIRILDKRDYNGGFCVILTSQTQNTDTPNGEINWTYFVSYVTQNLGVCLFATRLYSSAIYTRFVYPDLSGYITEWSMFQGTPIQ